MTNNILNIQSLKKSFGGLVVIDDVSFLVAQGSKTALIGPNGAGKTTIFNLLSGVYSVDEGSIHLDGVDITETEAHNRVLHGLSRSFQNIRLMPHLSTVENVMLGQQATSRSWRDMLYPLSIFAKNRWQEEAEEALLEAGIGTYPGEVVSNLPYGIQKRIEVVRAIISKPKLLLLDEPAAGLNRVETDQLHELLDRVHASGVTLLVVEHDMHFVRSLCDHVVVLNFGEKIFEGSPDLVQKDPEVLKA
ncbi:MAG: ABC transporter ATP-binding protein, partial [Rhodospirillales bacterium]|nr:ABC transporter ATP-binding protein [Rhodospirillales bacterium]